MTEQEWNVGGMMLMGDISSAPSTTNATLTGLRHNPGLCEEKPAALRLSYPRILCLGVRQDEFQLHAPTALPPGQSLVHTAYEARSGVDGAEIKPWLSRDTR